MVNFVTCRVSSPIWDWNLSNVLTKANDNSIWCPCSDLQKLNHHACPNLSPISGIASSKSTS
jgi:hypothetical protein